MTKSALRRINTDEPSASICVISGASLSGVSKMINRSLASSKERFLVILVIEHAYSRITETRKFIWKQSDLHRSCHEFYYLRLFFMRFDTCCFSHGFSELHRIREIRPARSNTFSDHPNSQSSSVIAQRRGVSKWLTTTTKCHNTRKKNRKWNASL